MDLSISSRSCVGVVRNPLLSEKSANALVGPWIVQIIKPDKTMQKIKKVAVGTSQICQRDSLKFLFTACPPKKHGFISYSTI
ncbi:hypothetical protein FNE76_05660 [Helicobacter mehlei]|uniref:Uncharacterized protein n=1 Tax=Helicobacter mehlei TaxID=2316080 RepID=A0A553UQJ5_9HELI|nr:hypothetical protein FNE76_05660 [Helicobacter mehlei]